MMSTYTYVISVKDISEIEKLIEFSDNLTFLVNGNRMLVLGDCYNKFAKKLNFPEYFGHNINALNDMLTDLSWLDFQGIHIFVENAYLFLTNEQKEVREILFNILESTGKFWAKPIQSNEVWDRNSINLKFFLF